MITNPKKKKIMKRIIQTCVVALVCMIAFQVKAVADNDKPIAVSQLPAVSQQVIKSHFAGKKVAMAKQETGLLDKNYEVVFTSGEKVELTRKATGKRLTDKLLSRYPAKAHPRQKITQG